MARQTSKNLQFTVDFTANMGKLTKQLDSEINSLKSTVGKNNPLNAWFDGVKGRSTELREAFSDMAQSLTKPGLNRSQFLKTLSAAQEAIRNINASLARSHDYLNRSFNSKGNQDNLAELKGLETQYKKLIKAKEKYDTAGGALKDRKAKYKKSLGMTAGEISKNAAMAEGIQAKGGKNLSKAEFNFLEKYKSLIPKIIEANKDLVASQAEVNKIFKNLGMQDVENSGDLNAKIIATRGAIKENQENTITPEKLAEVAKALEPVEKVSKAVKDANNELGPAAEKSSAQVVQAALDEEKAINSVKSVLNEFGISLSAAGVAHYFKQLIKQSWEFYKSLDAALTEISIVSNYSRDQVQALTNDFISLSQKTGMAIDDIAQASVIFFQQGLNTDEVMTMTEVTAQFAKVAGEDVTTAADQLTAAVNGFQIGVEHAIDVADKLNAVAAKSAASIEEISTAMEKSAAQANQAGVSMDRYLAYIATMEEVTREAPENIGTSLKTIMARFQQVKMGGTSEDGETDVNQVETALKSVGIALRDSNNQLRDLDDVLSELGPKWSSLDRNTQAYLGTVIAGTRQQSRFIALMQNWDRALELTAVSENSAGQQALMHAKAMEGLDASINTLTNSWQKFLTTLTSSDTFITFLNGLSWVLQNISQQGGTVSLIIGGLSFVFAKNQKAILNLTTALGKVIKKLSEFGKKLLNIKKTLKDYNKTWKENITTLKNAHKQVDVTKTKLAEAQKALNDGFANRDALQEDLDLVNQNMEAQGLSAKQMAALAAQKQDLTTKIKEQTAAIEEQKVKRDEATLAYENATQVEQEAVTQMTSSISAIFAVIGALETMAAVLGLADNAWVQFGIGLIGTVAGIVMTIKAASAVLQAEDKKLALSAPVVYMILAGVSLALTGITSLVQGFGNLTSDGSEKLEDLKNKQDEYTDSIKATKAALSAVDSNLKVYDTLSKKLVKTTEEQEQLNQAIKDMAEYYDLAYFDNGNGTYSLNRDDVQAARDAEAAELEKEIKEAQKNLHKTMEQAQDTKYKQKHGKWAAFWEWGENDDALINKEVADEYQATMISYLDDINDDMTTTYDAYGNVVASAGEKQALQSEIMNSYYDKLQKDYENKTLDEEEFQNAIIKAQKTYNQLFKENQGLYEEMIQMNNTFAEHGYKDTFGNTMDKIDAYYDKLKDKMLVGLTPGTEDYQTAIEQWEALKESAYNTVFGGNGTNILDVMNYYNADATKNTKLYNALRGLNTEALNALNNTGALDDAGGTTDILLEKMLPDIPTITQAFNESGEAGALALIDSFDKIMNDESLDQATRYAAQEAKKALVEELAVASTKTWSQLADTLDDITSSLSTMNKLVESLRENGGWTLDEFKDLADIMDDINSNWDLLDNESQTDYLNALQQMNFAYDEQNHLISADMNATQALGKIKETYAKAQIKNMINQLAAARSEMKVKLAAYNAEISATEAMITAMQAKAETGVTASELESEALTAYSGNAVNADAALADVYKSMGTNATNMAAASIEGLDAVGQLLNAIANGDYDQVESLASDFRNQVNALGAHYVDRISSAMVSGAYLNSSGGVDADKMDDFIAGLEKYKAGLVTARDNLAEQIINITEQIEWWERLSKSDLSGWGTEAAKAAEKYISKLQEMLELITHIEREMFKLSIYQKLYDEQTGKYNVENLKTQISLVKHLQNDYKQAYTKQKESLNQLAALIRKGYGDIITFDKEGNYSVNYDKYDKLSDKNKEELDDLISQYDEAIDKVDEYYENLVDKLIEEKQLRQEIVDKYIEAEDTLVEAIKQREEKILDNKLAAIDKEIEAIEKAAEARRKAREEEENVKELSGMQVDLQRALMDSSGASATQILDIQKQIKEKQQEMADNSFDTMVEDMQTQLEEEKELEQNLFDERLEEMDWYWDEVDRIMAEGTESVLDTMQLYLDDFNQASELQQVELLKGWENTFGQAAAIGKAGAAVMQGVISEIQQELNSQDIEDYLKYLTNDTVNTQYSGRTNYNTQTTGGGSGGGGSNRTNITSTPTKTTEDIVKDVNTELNTQVDKDTLVDKTITYSDGIPDPSFASGKKVKTKEGFGYVSTTLFDDSNLTARKHGKPGYTASKTSGSGTSGLLLNNAAFTTGKQVYYNGQWYYQVTDNWWLGGKNAYIKGHQLKYKKGGMVYNTGPAWLDGTSSHPEAVLNAMQTKAFLSFTDDLAALRAEGGMSTNSSVVIDNISFNVESMSSVADGEKAFNTFVDKFKEIGAKQGISILGTANRN